MDSYTNFDNNRNIDVAEDVERVTDRWARRLSRDSRISYDHALAVVQANAIVKGTRDD
jgi:hypothetical protein